MRIRRWLGVFPAFESLFDVFNFLSRSLQHVLNLLEELSKFLEGLVVFSRLAHTVFRKKTSSVAKRVTWPSKRAWGARNPTVATGWSKRRAKLADNLGLAAAED